MAAPSQAEIEVIIRYLQENKGELDKVQSALEELASRAEDVIKRANPKEMDRFIDSLNRLADEAEKSGEKLTALDHLMVGAVRSMATELDKAFPRSFEKLTEGANEAADALSKTADKMEELRVAAKQAIAAEDVSQIDALAKSFRELRDSTLEKGPPALTDRVLVQEIDRLSASLEKAKTSLTDLDAGTGLRTVAEELALVQKQNDAMEKGVKLTSIGVQEFTDDTAALDKSLVSLLSSLDATYGAQVRMDQSTDLLHQGLEAGIITQQQYDAALQRLQENYRRVTTEQRTALISGRDLTAVWTRLRFVATALLGALGVQMGVSAFIRLLKDAAASEALERGLRAVGENAGYSTQRIEEAKSAIEELAISSNVAAENLSQMMVRGLSPERSVELARAAKNLAATFGRPIEEAFEQVTSAVSRQSTMMLARQYGIVLEANEVFARKARELGRQILPSERADIFASEVLTEINLRTAAMGGATKTARTGIDELSASWEEFKDVLGELFLPLLKETVDFVRELIKEISGLVKQFASASSGSSDAAGSMRAMADATIRFVQYLREHESELRLLYDILSRFKDIPWAIIPGGAFLRPQTQPTEPPVPEKGAGQDRFRLFSSRPDMTPEELLQYDKDLQELDTRIKQAQATAELQARERQKDLDAQAQTDRERSRAREQGELEHWNIIVEINRSARDQLEALDQERLRNGVLTIEELHRRRVERWQQTLDDELKAARLATRNAQREVGRAAAEGPGTARVTEAQAALNAARERERAVLERANAERTQMDIDFRDQQKRRVQELAEYELDTLLKANDQLYTAQRERLELQAREDRERFGPGAEAAIQRRLDIELRLLDIERQRHFIAIENARAEAAVNIDQERLNLAVSRGMVNESERLNAQNAIIQRRISLVQEQIAQQERIQRSAYEGGLEQQYEDATQRLQELRLEMERLESQFETLGGNIRRNFTQELANALDKFGQDVRNIGEAVRSFLQGVIGNIRLILSQIAAQNITRAIIESTGGAQSGGIFGAIGRMLGDKGPSGKKGDGIYVRPDILASGDQTLEQILDPKGFFENLGDKVTEGFDWLSNAIRRGGLGISDLFSWLSNAISSVFSNAGGGFGGFFSDLLGGGAPLVGDFGVGPVLAAEGGRIVGPSHAQGGVPIVAEGGEHITNKRATARWLPLLEAINTGLLDRISGAVRPRGGFRYAEGGLVPRGGSVGPSVSISVPISVEGGSDIASNPAKQNQLQTAIRIVVQDEIIRQKNPGGALS